MKNVDPSPPKMLYFYLGGDLKGTLILVAQAIPLVAVGVLPFILIKRDGPVIETWQSLVQVGGMLSLAAGAVLMLLAGSSLVNGLIYGHHLTLDAAGAHRRGFFGGVTSVGWDEGLQVRLTERKQTVIKGEAPFIPLRGIGEIVSLLHEMTAERATVTIRGVRIESPLFCVKEEPDSLTMISLVRWLLCRELEKFVVARGGSVVWRDDGLSAVNLAGTYLTDIEFAPLAEQLAQLPQLKTLNLNHTRLTNDSLPVLQTFRSLESVECDGTELDPAAIQAILKAAAAPAKVTGFDFLKD